MDAAAPLKGLLAGLTGTVAMTLAMRHVFPRLLPRQARRGLLPERVMEGLERRLTGRPRPRRRTRRQATIPAHYAFGGAAGAGYGLVRMLADRAPVPLLGGVWGLGLWAATYQGLLPAAGVVPPTTSRPPSQWVVPIGAHIIFGVSTAYAFEALSAEPQGDRT